jgi:hypothetical protein
LKAVFVYLKSNAGKSKNTADKNNMNLPDLLLAGICLSLSSGNPV